MKTKIQIKSIFWKLLFEYESENNTIKETLIKAFEEGADLRGADLRDAYLRDADLRGADLRDADLRGAYLRGAKELPESFINEALQQIYFIAKHQKNEVPFLIERLKEWKIDGSQYKWDCCCFVWTLASKDSKDVSEYCSNIPYYSRWTHNPAENWFLNIREWDTPENNFFAERALEALELAIK